MAIIRGIEPAPETASARKLFVTEPHRPNRARYDAYVDTIFERNWFTNNGPLSVELEARLKKRLGLRNLGFVTNGTIALQLAIEALELKGEVLTTAFSFVATASSVAWQKIRPRMVDVEPVTLNIDPEAIERSITPETTGILATHVFGNPCQVEAIEDIARRHNLKVLYDGAHAFCTEVGGRSIFEYGDVSIVSFHATKLYHSVEGGGVVTNDDALFQRMVAMRNFGMNPQGDIHEIGINGKNSEFHAAMGLANLDDLDFILERRREISDHYDAALIGLPLARPVTPAGCGYNFAYYPVLFEDEGALLEALADLNAENIFPRRYFYPSLSTLDYVDRGLGTPVADDAALRVACLPLHTNMTVEDADRVVDALRRHFAGRRAAQPRYASAV